MGTVLTREQWLEVKATPEDPIFWRRIDKELQWERLHFELAEKWCVGNLNGWVYVYDATFVFGDEHDSVVFELWAQSAGFEKTSGHV